MRIIAMATSASLDYGMMVMGPRVIHALGMVRVHTITTNPILEQHPSVAQATSAPKHSSGITYQAALLGRVDPQVRKARDVRQVETLSAV